MTRDRTKCSPKLQAASRGASHLLCLCLVFFSLSCAREETGDHTVVWPEVTRFDTIALRADGFARTGDLESLKETRAELVSAGRAITPETIPSNAADPQQVSTILADLSSVIDSLSSEADDESLNALVQGLHPVIETLMAAAGMPHVHVQDHGDHDHGHSDHDH